MPINMKNEEKSGNIADQYMCCTYSSSRKSMTRHARFIGSLSSWNTKFAWKSLLANGTILVSGFPSSMEGTPYGDSAAACMYSRQYTLIE